MEVIISRNVLHSPSYTLLQPILTALRTSNPTNGTDIISGINLIASLAFTLAQSIQGLGFGMDDREFGVPFSGKTKRLISPPQCLGFLSSG
jgi:hypothetical protein